MIAASPADVFEAVTDLKARLQWDSLLCAASLHETLDEANALVYLKANPVVSGGSCHDYSLLQSWRTHEDGSYVVASRSVTTDALPPVRGCKRGAVLPSGFQLAPVGEGCEASEGEAGAEAAGLKKTRVTYILQMEPQRGITGHFQGALLSRAAEVMSQRMVSLTEYLQQAPSDAAWTPSKNRSRSIFAKAATSAAAAVPAASTPAQMELVESAKPP